MSDKLHSTTILAVRRDGVVAMGGDGQVTHNATVMKHHARKVRRVFNDKVLVGFAGSAADSFALLERFEGKLERYKGNVLRSAHELARDWRTDRVLRRLESMLIAADKSVSLLISGSGEVIEPDDGVVGIGSGGPMAVAAARAMTQFTQMPAPQIVEKSLLIAAGICVYTNENICVEELE